MLTEHKRALLRWFATNDPTPAIELDYVSRRYLAAVPWTSDEVTAFAVNYCPGLRMLGSEDFR